MEQIVTATWAELLAGVSAVTIIIVGATWAIMRTYFKRNYGSLQTQLDGVARAKPSHHGNQKPSVLTRVCPGGGGWPRQHSGIEQDLSES